MHEIVSKGLPTSSACLRDCWRPQLFLAVYVVWFGAILLTNQRFLAQDLFLVVVLPLALLLSLISALSFAGDKAIVTLELSTRRLSQLLSLSASVIFWSTAIYLYILSLSSFIQANQYSYLVPSHVLFSLEILSFLLITASLVIAHPRLSSDLLTAMSAIAATSALINMILFVLKTPYPERLMDFRLVPSLGMVEYQGATTVSLTYAIYAIGAVSTLAAGGWSRTRQSVLIVSAVVLSAAVLWTQSRSAYAAVLVGLAIAVGSASRVVRITLGTIVIAVTVIAAATPAIRNGLIDRGSSYRTEIWATYAAKALERPLFGYGRLSDISVAMKDGNVMLHPHNIVLAAQIRGGVLATAAMLVILIGGIFWGWRYRQKFGNAAPLCIMATMTVACMVDYELLTTYPTWPWVTFWLPIGISIGAELAARGSKSSSPSQ